MQLRDYQKNAVKDIKEKAERLLKLDDSHTLVFKAPTGSGKTIMVAEAIRELVRGQRYEKPLAFIWISVRKLHKQSKEKLESIYEDNRVIECSWFNELRDNEIEENEILFINWESINKEGKNVIVKENETDHYLQKVVENTKESGKDIILIVDESHHTAKSDKSQDLIAIIGPKVTIEVSATPNLKGDDMVSVHIEEVIAEEMIKQEVAVNPDFLDMKTAQKSTDEVILDEAIERREHLVELFKEEKANVNPLLLIQLPNEREGLESKRDVIIAYLKKRGITEDNGKLAIWLSEQKSETLANIEKNDCPVDALIFKEAIAVGWDCPRASILVVFREYKSFVFTIQTIGRIMRMPQLKHYDNEELNKGYVYTNLENIRITEDYVKDYITIYTSKRKDIYKPLKLPSIFLKRQRERTRLSGEFAKIFLELAEKNKLKTKIKVVNERLSASVMAEGKIKDPDKLGEVKHEGVKELKLSEMDTQRQFEAFAAELCKPFAPADSRGRIQTALYDFLYKAFRLERFSIDSQRTVLHEHNKEAFRAAIIEAKEEYQRRIVDTLNEKREIIRDEWDVPVTRQYTEKHQEQESKKCIMKPLYVRNASKAEEQFIEKLEKSKSVKWWYKNGEGERRDFAILYKDEHGFERGFCADYIVQLEDGTIGLYDTKAGTIDKNVGRKAEALQKYIKTQKKKLTGGIIMEIDGVWRINQSERYIYNEKDLKDWKTLEF